MQRPLAIFDQAELNAYGMEGMSSAGIAQAEGAAIGAAKSATGVLASLKARSLEDYVTIIVGLLLVGAGLFAFKQTQTLITTIGKTARNAAEVSG
jgi:fucose permease